MRMLLATGWINFRMRAMLVSFASYQLWQPWRPTALHLAREFLDYEPGIHYPQVQMQSGTTGINTARIYNPLKQALDQDPDGVFVRRWIPALARVPAEHIVEPWRMPRGAAGKRLRDRPRLPGAPKFRTFPPDFALSGALAMCRIKELSLLGRAVRKTSVVTRSGSFTS